MFPTRTRLLTALGALMLLTGCESTTQPSEASSPPRDPGAVANDPQDIPGPILTGEQQPKRGKSAQPN